MYSIDHNHSRGSPT